MHKCLLQFIALNPKRFLVDISSFTVYIPQLMEELNSPNRVKHFCEKCHAPIVCNAQLNIPCQCAGVLVSAKGYELIRQLGFKGCLCNKCLKEIEEQAQASIA
jgi:hypothetical protein